MAANEGLSKEKQAAERGLDIMKKYRDLDGQGDIEKMIEDSIAMREVILDSLENFLIYKQEILGLTRKMQILGHSIKKKQESLQ